MGEIKSHEENPVPGIAYSDIHIPDEDSLGTGVFTTVLHPGAFGKNGNTAIVVASNDFKASIVDRVGMTVTRIRISHRHVSDDGTIGVLGDRGVIQRQIGSNFVNVGDVDGKGLVVDE